jgi:hypothetical protein
LQEGASAEAFEAKLAGTYPAFFLASFDPVVALKTEMSGRSKKSNIRNVLVVFQFTVSIALIVGTVIVSRQLKYIQNRNLGFNKEQVEIIFLLSKQFTKWVVLSNLFAWPIAFYFMQKWLQRFAYQSGISVWSFLFAFSVVLSLALLTVSFQTVKAARSNPVELLRHE